jgi:hypothetical protein
MSGSKFVCIECHLNTHAMSLDRYGCEAGIDQVQLKAQFSKPEPWRILAMGVLPQPEVLPLLALETGKLTQIVNEGCR